MAKLTEQQKYNKDLIKTLQKALKNNQKEKYPISLDALAHNFWNDCPKFRNENQCKELDKERIKWLLNHAERLLNQKICQKSL